MTPIITQQQVQMQQLQQASKISLVPLKPFLTGSSKTFEARSEVLVRTHVRSCRPSLTSPTSPTNARAPNRVTLLAI